MATSIDVGSLAAHVGSEVAVSEWFEVTQARIDAFADATEDHQWIHVNPERAAAESPHQTTIAHGFLTLSLVSALLRAAVAVEGVGMAINYGCDRVRFVSPLPAGARIRGRFVVTAVQEVKDAVQVTWGVTVEREGHDKPCVVVSWLVRYYPSS